MRSLEGVKCIIDDEGMEVEVLDMYCVRAKSKTNKYIFDIWASKKNKFTVLKWSNKQYFKNVTDIEAFIKKHK